MKKRLKVSIITVGTALFSTIGTISLGFATWTINHGDTADVDGSIISDTLISLTGFRVVSVTTFDYGVYSFGNSSSFITTGDITYTIGMTPNYFDPDTKAQLGTGSKTMTINCKFNSFYEVFEKDNGDFVNFEGAKWDSNSVTELNSNGNNYIFSFTISGFDDLNSTTEITKELKFTFNNKLLVKQFGNDQTIANNTFTLSIGKEVFSL